MLACGRPHATKQLSRRGCFGRSRSAGPRAARGHSASYLAKRFAAKEAAAKALGTGIGHGISWQHMQIENDEHGAPVLILTGPAAQRQVQLGSRQAHISLADETDQAIAFVVLS